MILHDCLPYGEESALKPTIVKKCCHDFTNMPWQCDTEALRRDYTLVLATQSRPLTSAHTILQVAIAVPSHAWHTIAYAYSALESDSLCRTVRGYT